MCASSGRTGKSLALKSASNLVFSNKFDWGTFGDQPRGLCTRSPADLWRLFSTMWFAAKEEGAKEEGTRRAHSRDQQETRGS